MNKKSKIYIAGHRGMVGSAIFNRLKESGYTNLILKTSSELDLRRQKEVEDFFQANKPDYVFLAAAKVGGIMANSQNKAAFFYDNQQIATNVINASYQNGVKKLMNLGSSCIYPKMAPQPLKEEYLLTGPLEETNDAYAIAKISAIKMCQFYNEQYGTDFLSVMPTNLYGPNDNYDLKTSHVMPAMIRKFHEAKQNNTAVTLWGDGTPKREFLYSEDLAEAVIFLMENYHYSDLGEFVNIGTGMDMSIAELADTIKKIVGADVDIEWDTSKPNGTPRKVLDISKLTRLGWKPKVALEDGVRLSYEWFLEKNVEN